MSRFYTFIKTDRRLRDGIVDRLKEIPEAQIVYSVKSRKGYDTGVTLVTTDEAIFGLIDKIQEIPGIEGTDTYRSAQS